MQVRNVFNVIGVTVHKVLISYKIPSHFMILLYIYYIRFLLKKQHYRLRNFSLMDQFIYDVTITICHEGTLDGMQFPRE